MQSLPWYQSKVIVGSIISMICLIAGALGLVDQVTAADQAVVVDKVIIIVGAAGNLWAIIARLTQKQAPPITAVPRGPNLLAFLLIAPLALTLSACAISRTDMQTAVDVSEGACLGYLEQPRSAADQVARRCQQLLGATRVIELWGLIRLVP